MSNPGTGDGSSPRSKRSRKDTAKPADDVTTSQAETGDAAEGRPKTKRSGSRSSRKTAQSADRAAAAGTTTSDLGTPAAGAPDAAATGSSAASQAEAPNEEVPLLITREEVTVTEDGDDIEILIRRRAYEIYLERGGGRGDPMTDWITAEHEVRSRGR